MGQFAIGTVGFVGWMLVVLSYCAIEDWPQWRGPQRDGHATSFKLPAPWPETLDQVWRVEVGQGHASPVVAEQRVYIFSRRDDDEVFSAYQLSDGKLLWQHNYPAPYEVNAVAAAHGKGPKSTPTVAGSRVFTYGISGILTCWHAKTGKLLWQRDFSKQMEQSAPLYGVAMSPVVDEDKCIVHVGGNDKGALLALDVKSGETLWSCPEDGPAYASPIVVTIGDVRQVVTQSQISDGELLWKIPFQTEYDQNSVTPLEHDGYLIFSGFKKGIDRYLVERVDDEWQTDNTWENKEVSLYMSSPIADHQRLFGFSHLQKGQFFAIDLTTGKTLWTSPPRQGENASLVQTGKVLWGLTTGGDLIVFAASDKHFEPLARYKVATTPVWAHPVVLPGGVLVKDESHLTLWGFPKKP